MKILIAEDDRVTHTLLEGILARWGYEVVVTTNGHQAWEVLKGQDAPPIAILDWMMPEIDGIEVCRRVREREGVAYTYLILLTAKSHKADLVTGLTAGADDYIIKPFDHQELWSRLRVGERMIALEQELAQKIRDLEGAEESLRRSHAETSQFLNAIQSILIGVDAQGKIIWWNHAAQKIFAMEEAEVVGKSLNACGAHWNFPDITARLAEMVSQQEPVYLNDVLLRRAQEEEAILGFALHPFKQGPEGASGGLLIGVDVTQRRILEAQLCQAQKLESIGQIAAGIAHEINTPTQYVGDNTRFIRDAFTDIQTVLEKFTELLESVRGGSLRPELIAEVERELQATDIEYLSEEVPHAIEQSLEGVSRIARIVQSMKDFAHPGSGEKMSADINKAIESTITVARNEWKYVAEMETHFDKALPPVPCLLGEFNQVILNMIINATHAIADVVGDGSQGKGKITVTTAKVDDAWVEVRVADTGTGIPVEARSRIFDPFFTTKEVGKGTGQGLAISHTVIVEKHGGQLSFETEMGRGTAFIIRLPLEPSGKTCRSLGGRND